MDAETNTEGGLTINGELYEVPNIFSFTIDEAEVLYDCTGLTIEDLVPVEDQDEEQKRVERVDAKIAAPQFKRAICAVAYMRRHPDVTPAEAKRLVGSTNLIVSIASLREGADARPPDGTTVPGESSPRSTDTKPDSSGAPSTTDSAALDVLPAPTGTSRSDTSSTSPQPTIAASAA